MMSDNPARTWTRDRQKIAWEPEILITGVVLFSLIQIPDLLDSLTRYLNDRGPQIFFSSDIDEVLIVFLNTSVFFLISGLIITLLMRSVWVVMIAMSYLYPTGVDLDKFKFQPFFQNSIERSTKFDVKVDKLDRLCSLLYSLTFFTFMCIVGIVFFILIVGGVFLIIFSYIPITPEINQRINLFISIIGGIYLLDFLSLGWFKRFSWFSKIYRPFYFIMSFLTLAPLYRNIYYALISRFNRWKILLGLMFFILLTILLVGIQRGKNFKSNPFNSSEIYVNSLGTTVLDGNYRDKNSENLSNWFHISSATVEKDVLEIFVSHKVALEESIFDTYELKTGLNKEAVLSNDSLRMAALSNYYRFRLDGNDLKPVPFVLMEFTEYNQKGMLGFIPLDTVSKGQHTLELYLNNKNKTKVAELVFYKTND